MSRSQAKRPRDAARLATRQAAAAPAITAPASTPASNQNPRPFDPSDRLITTGADQSADAPTLVPIGAGFDTSRYGHYAAFLRADLQPAAADLKVVESALGYQQLRERLDAIA